jgi:anhydro-N-acetylmuramic acid kinase
METNTRFKMIGLMSGTSGDGLDMVYCEFEKKEIWSFRILNAETVPFPRSLEKSLRHSHLLAGEELALLDLLFGKWMGQCVRTFCEKYNIIPDAISSHGHTVFHQPERGFTLQIGNGWALHEASGFPVVNDFRTLDVLRGGQGAPLVPVGDQHLFGEYDFCLNLGGIANISMDAATGRKAFDICPFNLLLNHFAQKEGRAYDDEGSMAQKGRLFPELLQELENLNFYQMTGAKSLGRENIKNEYLPILNKYQDSTENILATLIEHYCIQIGKAILQNWSATKIPSILVTGGGTYNQHFLQRLGLRCGNRVDIIIPDNQIIDFKEALIFAFLGVLRIKKENNCLRSVTGANKDSCAGSLFGFG